MTAPVATISPRGRRPQLSIDVRGDDDLRSPGVQKTPLNGDGDVVMDFETEADEDTSSTTTCDDDEEEEHVNNNNNGVMDGVDVLVLEGDVDAGPTIEQEEEGAVVASPSSGDISIDTEIEMIKTESGSSSSTGSRNTAADPSPLANFITQTDASGKASTPRNAPITNSSVTTTTVAVVTPSNDIHDDTQHQLSGGGEDQDVAMTDVACETIITAFGRMCCCIDPALTTSPTTTTSATVASSLSSSLSYKGSIPRGRVANEDMVVVSDSDYKNKDCSSSSSNSLKVATPSTASSTVTSATTAPTPTNHPIGYSTRGHDAPPLLEGDSALYSNPNNIKLLPSLDHSDYVEGTSLDGGVIKKKCLVLDLDETLVHSSFRAVKGADFVLPVQIEDVVHFVYVTKRPGVDAFLLEMSKYYEIIIYTASLNKYADALLDLLDTHRVIHTRLFRESCVYYEGNYIKDLALLNRPLDQTIIIDNSPASYMFHPENAIDCGSFIDDPNDVELDQIGQFLIGLKDVSDVRGTVNLWRHWPNVDLKTKNIRYHH